jgi:hypothetical protein
VQSENVPTESGVIRISEKQVQRHHLLRMVLERRISLLDAGQKMGVSYNRQAKRLQMLAEREGMNVSRETVRAILDGQE